MKKWISLNKIILFTLLFIGIPVNAGNKDQIPKIFLTGNFGYDYQEASVTIITSEGEKIENLTGKVKWRGGSTNTVDKHKRNYKIKFDKDQQLFGMRKDNNWILDAGQADLFRLRNRIATEIWNAFSHKPYYINEEPDALTGVRGQLVEVYLNEDYIGIYSLTECMDRKQLKLKKYNNATGEIKGGLWKSDSYGISLMWEVVSYDNKKNTWGAFEVKYPELDDLEETDYSTLYNAIYFVVNSSDEEFKNNVGEYFDLPVIIDYYIFLHTLNAFDNVGKNMFWAVYDKTINKKLTLAVWDLDDTVGAKWLGDWTSPEYNMNINFNLIVRLKELNVDGFNEKAIDRYHQLRNNCLSTDSLIHRYNSYYELLKKSGAAQREEEKWSGDSDINGETINFDDEIIYIRNWLTKHMDYLDTTTFLLNMGIENIQYKTVNKDIIYNLYGQRIINPKKGIYIKNKRKYIYK